MKNRDHTPQKPKDLPRRTEEPPRPHKSPKTRPSAEAALFQDQEKYRLLAESSPLGIAVVDVNGRYTYLNPKFVEMFGYALDDIHTGREWFAKAYPDAAYRARILSDWKLYVQESQAGEAQPRVFTVTCKDGSAKVIKFRGVPLENGEQVIFYEDITQRKELEEALQESKAHYRTLFETTPDAISLFDTDLKLIKANQAAANLYGVERPEEMLGRSSHEFVAPESLALAQELNQKALSTENIIEAEFVLLKSDGSPFIAETRTSILRNSGGSPKAFLAVAKDITERKQYEEKLLQAKEEWERTFNAIPDLVMILDNQYRIVRVNQTMAHRYGCDPEEMVGKFCYQLIHDLEAPPPFCPSSAMLSHGQPVQLETWDQKLESYLLITTSPIYDPSGRIMGSVQVGTDITERKLAEEALRKSEEKYRLLVGQIPAVVFKGYEDWSIECFDDKIETLTGYSKEDFNRRRLTWRDLIVTEDLPYVKDVFHKALAGDGAYFREHRIKKKSDELAWVQCRGQIVRDEKGAVEYISGVTFDITAHKEAEAALRESEERYRLMAENVSDVIWTANLDLVSTYISPSVQHLLGFTPEEIIGRSLGEFLPPASLGRALEVLSEEMVKEEQGLADPNRSRMLELEELHKDGYSIQTEVKASFIRGAYNQPIGILGVTRDITKRKEAEEALLRRDAVLEAVSFAAEKFLKTRFWEEDIQKILERLGLALEVSRVSFFENQYDEDGPLLGRLRHEWVAANIRPQIDHPEFQGFSYRAGGFGRWEKVLPQRQIIWGHVEELPPAEREILAAQGIKSLVVVPIFVGQQWWGGLSFDDCIQEREWSSMEVDALVTAASILGLTILHHKEEKALRESEEKLRSLSYQLLTAQEQERKRLASELHNVLGHDLLLLKLKLESFRDELGPDHLTGGKGLQPILRALQDSVGNVRRLCQDLIPGDLEDLGLTTGLHLLVENFAVAKKLKWQTELEDLHDLFEMPVQIAIYRMVQEALTNIGKHAQAKHLWLRGRRAGTEVSFAIEDDGQGFNVAETLAAKKTLGLLSMEERIKILGGAFDIVSREKEGTKISFTIPIFKGGD